MHNPAGTFRPRTKFCRRHEHVNGVSFGESKPVFIFAKLLAYERPRGHACNYVKDQRLEMHFRPIWESSARCRGRPIFPTDPWNLPGRTLRFTMVANLASSQRGLISKAVSCRQRSHRNTSMRSCLDMNIRRDRVNCFRETSDTSCVFGPSRLVSSKPGI
jgi:hypothetical protein